MIQNDLTLYTFSWGLYPRRVQIYLAEKGLSIPTFDFDPQTEAKWPPPEIAVLHPYKKFPILKVGDNTVITESLAILHYLEKIFPENSMVGGDDIDFANIMKLVAIADEANSILAIWNHNISPLFSQSEVQLKDAGYSGAYFFLKKMDVLETAIADEGGEFLYGDGPTIADCIVLPLIMFLDEFYDVQLPKRFKKLTTWYNTFKQRPSVASCDYVGKYPQAMLEASRGLEQQSGFTLEELCQKMNKELLN